MGAYEIGLVVCVVVAMVIGLRNADISDIKTGLIAVVVFAALIAIPMFLEYIGANLIIAVAILEILLIMALFDIHRLSLDKKDLEGKIYELERKR